MLKNIRKWIEGALLTSLIDRFKAKNPETFAAIITILTAVKLSAIAVVGLHLDLQEAIPRLVEIEWLKAVPAWLGTVIWIVTEILTSLTGSSTKGVGTLVLLKQEYTDDSGKVYPKGRPAYLPQNVASALVIKNFAQYIETK